MRNDVDSHEYAYFSIFQIIGLTKPLENRNPLTPVVTISKYPDKMLHKVIVHQGMHCSLQQIWSAENEMFFWNYILWPFKIYNETIGLTISIG